MQVGGSARIGRRPPGGWTAGGEEGVDGGLVCGGMRFAAPAFRLALVLAFKADRRKVQGAGSWLWHGCCAQALQRQLPMFQQFEETLGFERKPVSRVLVPSSCAGWQIGRRARSSRISP